MGALNMIQMLDDQLIMIRKNCDIYFLLSVEIKLRIFSFDFFYSEKGIPNF